MSDKIACIVVTYNRKKLLFECLSALYNQYRRPDKIFIIDNGSTDGTYESAKKHGVVGNQLFEYVRLHGNTGGAGGFSTGMKIAKEKGFDWVWMMDDDACPEKDALLVLISSIQTRKANYGSVAVDGCKLSWGMGNIRKKNMAYENWDELPDQVEVWMLPFIGLMVSSLTMDTVGFVDADYFIAADDVEYCFRCRKYGIPTIAVKNSRIGHPRASSTAVNIFNKKIMCLTLNPMKRYYDTRNRILLAKKYCGIRLILETLPASFVRLFVSLRKDRQKFLQLKAFWAGTIDGLLGFKGRRHETYNIPIS